MLALVGAHHILHVSRVRDIIYKIRIEMLGLMRPNFISKSETIKYIGIFAEEMLREEIMDVGNGDLPRNCNSYTNRSFVVWSVLFNLYYYGGYSDRDDLSRI